MEVETDKANVEIEAFGSGVLRKIVVGAGEQVPVGQLIGVIADPSEDVSSVAGDKPAAPAAAPPSESAKPAAATANASAPPQPAVAAPPTTSGKPADETPAPAARREVRTAPAQEAPPLPQMETYQSTPATTNVVPMSAPSAGAPARHPGERVQGVTARPQDRRAWGRSASRAGQRSRRPYRPAGRRDGIGARPAPDRGCAAPAAPPPAGVHDSLSPRGGVRGRRAYANARLHRQAHAALEGAGAALLRHHRGGDGSRHGSAGGAERGSKASPRSR